MTDSNQLTSPAHRRLHDLFDAKVERVPDAPAVSEGAADLTYRELWRRANRLASHLRRLGVGPESRVGLCLERSADALTGILGILKAGGAYVPLDPAYPRARLAYMLEDSGARWAVTRQDLWEGLGLEGAEPVRLDADADEIARHPDRDPAAPGASGNLAYLIYTSGSTGRAKGVAIEHRSAVAFLDWALGRFSRDELSGVLAATSFCFDLSVFEIFAPLSAGGRVILARNALQLPELPAARSVTLVNTVPSAMAELLRVGLPRSVRTVNLAGEPLRSRLASQVYAVGVERLFNLYGPSEDTTYSTEALVPRAADRPPTIGRPLPGTQAWVLGPDLEPVAGGATGELFLGGAGLARGYLGRPELTAERFVPDLFSNRPGERLYRTGDLVRRLPDGELEFLGRADHQIKLRGFRIELGEIEAVLCSLPGVSDAAVVVRELADGEHRLVAYAELVPGLQPGADELRKGLTERLPAHMVPGIFVLLPALPRLPNGKIDRGALPEPPTGRAGVEVPYEAPRSALEQEIASLWEELTGVAPVGRRDPFLALGGHSLLAAQVSARLRETLEVDLPAQACLAAPTVAELAVRVEELRLGKTTSTLPPLMALPREGDLPLSDAQRRLWFFDRLAPGSPLYNLPRAVRLRGRLDADALARSLARVVDRHEALRTAFALRDHEPVQVIAERVEVPLPVTDLRHLPAAEREAAARAGAEAVARTPFDLGTPPLLRAGLFRLGDEDWLLALVLHHVVADDWSLEILFRELEAGYATEVRGAAPTLPPLPVQYADFARWQLARQAGDALREPLARWRERLKDAPPVLDLPVDRPRPAAPTWRGATLTFAVPAAAVEGLRRLARREGATLFMASLAVLQALLVRMTGKTDFVVGAPAGGRPHRELEGLIGFFVNLLPLRADVSGDPAGRELLRRVRDRALDAYTDQDVPFDRIVEELRLPRDAGRSPLFQVALAEEDTSELRRGFAGCAASRVGLDTGTAKHELILFLEAEGEGLRGALEYSTDLFEPVTATALAERFGRLLEALAESPETPIAELPVLSAEESRLLLVERNRTEADFDPRPVHEQIAARAGERPDLAAIRAAETETTYRELEDRANQLARHLRRMGVAPESVVGVLAERSAGLVEAQLAVLKAGAAYMPLAPDLPPARMRYMLEDSRAAVLLAQDRLLDRLSDPPPLPVLRIADRQLWAGQPVTDPRVEVHPEGLAYLIYTSGSTGEPKAVMLCHRGLANLVAWHRRSYGPAVGARASWLAGLSFDAAAKEQWSWLSAGVTLCGGGDDLLLDPSRLLDWAGAERIEYLFVATPVAERLLAEAPRPGLRLRSLSTGGDALRRRPDAAAPYAVMNLYGPTEATVEVSGTVVEPETGQGTAPSIGRPIGNVRVYLLDARWQPVPPGAAGELWVGGEGVARGYLGRPGLTAGRFVPDPFSGRSGARLYRTSDRVRWRSDGHLEFLGRIDHQVKIRGLRVEPGEIEACLVRHAGVREAVVLLAQENAGTRLVAWIVPASGSAPTDEALRESLRDRLPAAMIPAAFVRLDALPLTSNGKVDRRALPPPPDGPEEGAEAAVPRTATEELLLGIWRQVLGSRPIGLHDDFFLRGGHSLLAAQVLSRIQAALGVDLPLRSLFESPTVAQMAARVTAARAMGAEASPPLVRTSHRGRAPLSLTQQGLWFLSLLEPESSFYNIPFALRLRGPLDAAALEQAVGDLARRHEALRTTLQPGEEGGGPWQVIAPELRIALPVEEVDDLDGVAVEVARPFDLTRGPLLRARLLRLGPDEHLLVLTVHHAVADGWSMNVLHRELAACYEARRRGVEPVLSEPPFQPADYAAWQRRCVEAGWVERRVGFWKERLAGLLAPLELPADRQAPAVRTHRGRTVRASVPPPLADALRNLAGREAATLLMVLRAGFEALLARLTGRERFLVGAPFAGRNRPELEDLVGFCVHVLPVPADLSGCPAFRDLLARVRATALAAWDHQDVSFERLVEELQPPREDGRNPLFEVLFAGNPPAPPVAWPDLEATLLETDTGTAKFDLTLFVDAGEESLRLALEVDADRFEEATARRLLDHLLTLLEGAAAEPGKAIDELPLLRAPEHRRLLEEWGRTEAIEPCDRCIHEIFEERCAESPDAVALVAGSAMLTYGELNRRANRLAHRLRRLGVGADQPVGLAAERSFELVVGLLGILKAGGAYLPLDPSYPAERLAFMVADARLSVLVGTESQLAGLPGAAYGELWTIRLDDEGVLAGESAENPRALTAPHGLAYVLFTSGSTGRPKGVAVPHRGVVRLVRGTDWARFGPDEVFFQYAPVSFDLSTLEVWGPLLHGARLVLPPAGRLSLEELGGELRCHGVTFLWLTAGLFHLMVDKQLDSLRHVRQLVAGGDVLSVPHCERVLAALDGTLINGYGPTENTTFTTCHPVRRGVALGSTVPIGRPVAATSVVIVDRAMRLLPPGVPGELLTGGEGLARGYFGRADLTAERFVPDPDGAPGVRLYRTGDLARWLADGTVEFLGRIDQQVKIRGFRIEPGEIETVLGAHPEVRECVVVARSEGGDKRLVAYVVTRNPQESATGELRGWLAGQLPEHMVPSAFVALPALPLSPNGKVDRTALPAPETRREEPSVLPRVPLEAVVADLWAETLDLDAVGIHDDFFALGGHSLLATRLVSRIHQVFRVDLPLRALFRRPTVAGIAEALGEDPAQRARVERIAELLTGLDEEEEEEEEDESALSWEVTQC